MPEFIGVRCSNLPECGVFQVIQKSKQKNTQLFVCKICHTKQSIRKLYATSFSAADVRAVVMQLNQTAAEAHQSNIERSAELIDAANANAAAATNDNSQPDDEPAAGEYGDAGAEDAIDAMYRTERRNGNGSGNGRSHAAAQRPSQWLEYLPEEEKKALNGAAVDADGGGDEAEAGDDDSFVFDDPNQRWTPIDAAAARKRRKLEHARGRGGRGRGGRERGGRRSRADASSDDATETNDYSQPAASTPVAAAAAANHADATPPPAPVRRRTPAPIARVKSPVSKRWAEYADPNASAGGDDGADGDGDGGEDGAITFEADGGDDEPAPAAAAAEHKIAAPPARATTIAASNKRKWHDTELRASADQPQSQQPTSPAISALPSTPAAVSVPVPTPIRLSLATTAIPAAPLQAPISFHSLKPLSSLLASASAAALASASASVEPARAPTIDDLLNLEL